MTRIFRVAAIFDVMNIRRLFILVPALVLVWTSCEVPSEKEHLQRPNIILIMSDDHGWFDVGFNGNTAISTPHMDAIAARGVILDRFYAASAVCSPTRASVLTGRNPLRTNISYANDGHLKRQEITIPEILKEQGYVTGHYGKWHLGTLTQTDLDANRGGRDEYRDDYSIPSEHGYDEFFCTESKVPTHDPMIFPAQYIEGESKRFGWRAVGENDSTRSYGTAYWEDEGKKASANLQGDDARLIIDRVIPFMEEADENGNPFFTTIWFHTPHLPVVSDSAHRSIYEDMDLQEQIYYGSISAMDDQMGRVWQRLQELDILENTLLFYCSDNGPEVNTPGSAGRFRDRKRSLYEGGVRVPAFVVWPGTFQENRRIDFPMVTSDYLPTILEILGIQYDYYRPLDGMSVLKAIQGEMVEREKPIGFICRPMKSWVTHQYKLVGDLDGDAFEMYDVLNDPGETKNLMQTLPEISEALISDFSKWQISVENSRVGRDYVN